jgi:hypothetical protein
MTVERLIDMASILEVDLHVMLDAVLDARPDITHPPASTDPSGHALITALRSEIDFLRQLVLRGEGRT